MKVILEKTQKMQQHTNHENNNNFAFCRKHKVTFVMFLQIEIVHNLLP